AVARPGDLGNFDVLESRREVVRPRWWIQRIEAAAEQEGRRGAARAQWRFHTAIGGAKRRGFTPDLVVKWPASQSGGVECLLFSVGPIEAIEFAVQQMSVEQHVVVDRGLRLGRARLAE